MKYSKWIGIAAAISIIIAAYSPWVFIGPIQKTITGFDTAGTSYGRPGLLSVYISVIAVLLFLIPKVWAKRTNIFVAAFNMAWSLRNFIIISMCSGGECPQKKYGLYLLLAASAIMMLMAFLPEGKMENKQPKTV